MNARPHFISTQPKPVPCHRCKRIVLEGIADGGAYQVDAIPLNLLGETTARIHGRSAYRLIAGRLVHRDHYDIAVDVRRGRPPVAATHTCEPIDPRHVDPAHVAAFLRLTAEPAPEPVEQEQHSLFVITGANAGARITAVTVDDPPF